MEEVFTKDEYSFHFKGLKWIGMWNYDYHSKWKNRFFMSYRCFVISCSIGAMTLQFAELYRCRNDLKLITFNLSTTALPIGILLKTFCYTFASNTIDELRWSLFVDMWHQKKAEEIRIHKHFRRIYSIIRKILVYSLMTFIPLWVSSSLFSFYWGTRHLPFSAWLPFNLEDDRFFALMLTYQSILIAFAGTMIAHEEMCFYSIMLQISTQYSILSNDIQEVGKKYQDREEIAMKKDRLSDVRKGLVKCLNRHLQLIGYTKKFSKGTHEALVVGMFTSGIAVAFNSLEVLQDVIKGNTKWWYHSCNVALIAIDVFLVNTMGNILRNEKEKLYDSLYQLPWYDMDVKTRKIIYIMSMGMRTNLTFTVLKVFDVEVPTFTWAAKSIISILILLWQLMNRF